MKPRKKKVADSLYGSDYRTPQLLYIVAVYHAKQREDSTAKSILTQIIAKDAGSPLANKAENLISVLNRRASIEDELTTWLLKDLLGIPLTKPGTAREGRTIAPCKKRYGLP